MWEDPIIDDAHRTRETQAAEFDFDVKSIFADLRKRQACVILPGCPLNYYSSTGGVNPFLR